jgi:Ca2+/H+ antiporter
VMPLQATPAREHARQPIFDSPSSSHVLRAEPLDGPMPAVILPSFEITASPRPAAPADVATSQTDQRVASGAHRPLARLGRIALAPLHFALQLTCPECAHDSARAHWYPVTLLTAFAWISLFSTAVAAVVTRWGVLLCVPTAFLGLYVVAIGAEIPDTIQSVTVARRGYGSMAVSNATGSQIINILIGLGFPWLMTGATGRQVALPSSSIGTLQLLASLQGANVAVYFSLLLLPTVRTWLPGDHSKAVLGRHKGAIFLSVYAIALIVFPIFRATLY